MSIGERVRKARKEKGMTQEQLASRVGLKQATISELENGESASTGSIARIAAVLEVSPLWLETGKGTEKAHLRAVEQPDDLDQALRLLQLFRNSTSSGRSFILDAAEDAEKLPGLGSADAVRN